jgi:hypothetical protein
MGREMDEEPLVSHKTAAVRLKSALALLVGQGRMYSFEQCADACGMKPRTIRSYVDNSTPGMAGMLSLFAAMPLSFTNAILSLANLRAERLDAAETVTPNRALTDLAKQTAELACMLEDGHLDHRERLQAAPALRELGGKLLTLAADLERTQK